MNTPVHHVVVDGRVFGTEAADRGMGRYVDHLAELLVAAGHRVMMLLPGPQIASPYARRGVDVCVLSLDEDPASCTVQLNRFLAQAAATLYLDATPFLPPMRYDVHACPVVAILYDLIPMRFPKDYFGSVEGYPMDVYVNGLARVRKAERVIAISDYVKTHALRYLGHRARSGRRHLAGPAQRIRGVRARGHARITGTGRHRLHPGCAPVEELPGCNSLSRAARRCIRPRRGHHRSDAVAAHADRSRSRFDARRRSQSSIQ